MKVSIPARTSTSMPGFRKPSAAVKQHPAEGFAGFPRPQTAVSNAHYLTSFSEQLKNESFMPSKHVLEGERKGSLVVNFRKSCKARKQRPAEGFTGRSPGHRPQSLMSLSRNRENSMQVLSRPARPRPHLLTLLSEPPWKRHWSHAAASPSPASPRQNSSHLQVLEKWRFQAQPARPRKAKELAPTGQRGSMSPLNELASAGQWRRTGPSETYRKGERAPSWSPSRPQTALSNVTFWT